MSTTDPTPALPRVAGILVVSDGAEWLAGVLATLARLRYPRLDLVAVDAGSTDGSRQLLQQRFTEDRLVLLDENVGFGRAVAAAVSQVEAVSSADLILLLHDDLILAPHALKRMVRALVEDPSLDVVGPKLRDWSDERTLQQVGMTIDRLGRAESILEPGELDQGQHDTQREVLYVSTAGMLLRRDILRDVGGFDPRFPVFRDDLDFCWRAWLAGRRVEVVPQAVGYHIGAASRLARPVGTGRPWEARYLAERHTLATMLKNYGAMNLIWAVPVVLLVGLGKVIGFLATRRLGDALATVLAYGWNLGQLPRTLRRRRRVQRHRTRGDRELDRLFAPGLPRLRSYAEALGSWLAGGSTRALLEDPGTQAAPSDDVTGLRALARSARAHPALTVGAVLAVLYLIGIVPFLGAGQLVGGEVAPWPQEAGAFLSSYGSAWNGEPLGSRAFASPAQALLGLVSFAGLDSAWLAQRLVVLGLLPLAWGLAVRAGRVITTRPGPRVLGATLYVLSPVVLGAFGQGRLGLLAVAALLPGLLLLGVRVSDGTAPAAGAWRATALFALGLAAAGATHPALLPLVAILPVVLLVGSVLRARPGRRVATRRLALGTGIAVLLLSPWIIDLARVGWSSVTEPGRLEQLPLWRALGLVPQTLPGLDGHAGLLVAATSAAVVLAALILGWRVRPAVVAGLVLLWTLSALGAWAAARWAVPGVWPPAVLLPAALAQGGLGVLAVRWITGSLAGYAFGVRQLGTVVIVTVLGVGLAAGFLRVADGPWTGIEVEPELVPAFVPADTPRVGPYRVLVLRQDPDGTVRWDVTSGGRPDMTEFGTLPHPDLIALLSEGIGHAVAGVDPRGGSALGLANVRYVVVAETGSTPQLVASLNRQPALEPTPAGGSRVWRVRTWMPRAVVVPQDRATALEAAGDPGVTEPFEELGLRRLSPTRYVGENPHPEGGLLVLSEGESRTWVARGDGERLARAEVEGVNAFEVPAGVEQVSIQHTRGTLHTVVVALQALLAFLVLSLALRPPGTGPMRAAARGRDLPGTFEEDVEDAEAPDVVVPATMAGRVDTGPREGEDRP